MIQRGFRWVFLITGTIIGAGYASGREIWQFFGQGSGLAIILFTIMAMICIYVILLISYEAKSTDYSPVLKKITGKKIAAIYDYMILLYLFCITIVMIAGSGASFQGYGLSFWTGASFIAAVLFLLLRKGMNMAVVINEWIMPLLIAGLLFILASYLIQEKVHLLSDWPNQSNWAQAFPFTALNILPLIAVLGAVGKQIVSKGEIYVASIISGLLLGTISFVYNVSLVHIDSQMILNEIPLFSILGNYDFKIGLLMAVLLWLAILTTAAANLMGMVSRIRSKISLSSGKIIFIILLVMLPLSGIGFSRLVSIIYPIYGLLNLYVLLQLLLYPLSSKKRSS